MSQKLENAKSLYLEGIRDGNAREAITKYTGDRYTQHSTGVADGIEGFVAFFEPFLERCPVRDIRIIRAIEDGPNVFLHVFQDINNGEAKWVTADIFDTDSNDKIIEHWDVIQAYEAPTASGRTMIDGPTEVVDLDKTDSNKQLVREFIDDVLIGGKFDRAAHYISATDYAQHNPAVKDGLAGLAEFIEELDAKDTPMRYRECHLLLGQGNFVASLSHVELGSEGWAVIDLFRLHDDKIVEHWDVQEKILPKEQWGNSGKF